MGSAMYASYVVTPGEHNTVYYWEVLHHTDLMWLRIKLALKRVNKVPESNFYLAIYND